MEAILYLPMNSQKCNHLDLLPTTCNWITITFSNSQNPWFRTFFVTTKLIVILGYILCQNSKEAFHGFSQGAVENLHQARLKFRNNSAFHPQACHSKMLSLTSLVWRLQRWSERCLCARETLTPHFKPACNSSSVFVNKSVLLRCVRDDVWLTETKREGGKGETWQETCTCCATSHKQAAASPWQSQTSLLN